MATLQNNSSTEFRMTDNEVHASMIDNAIRYLVTGIDTSNPLPDQFPAVVCSLFDLRNELRIKSKLSIKEVLLNLAYTPEETMVYVHVSKSRVNDQMEKFAESF